MIAISAEVTIDNVLRRLSRQHLPDGTVALPTWVGEIISAMSDRCRYGPDQITVDPTGLISGLQVRAGIRLGYIGQRIAVFDSVPKIL